jgi:hypothetical protein
VGDYQRLKELLVGDERAEIDRQRERLAELERERAALPDDLPRLLVEAQRGGGRQKLADALSAPVAGALGEAVRQERQTIVDALFPIIGPAIRKAIVEALRDFSDGFNRALESSFTPRGLKWRFESWRTGVPYAQVVLKNTLSFRLDHLFLIDRENGLVIARESAPELADLDADAIAGMLTAIGDFVRDSVGSDAVGSLASATVGEHLLWVVEGPRANLAVFLRGVPPAQLRLVLQERLERIHALLPGDTVDGAVALPGVREALDLDRLRHAAANDPAQAPRKARSWPLVLLALAGGAALAWWLVNDWLWARRLHDAEALLRAWPGIHLDGVDGSTRGEVVVRGLYDPLAESPRAALAAALPPDTSIEFHWRGYVSTDPVLVERRATQLLAPPDGVRVMFRDGRLALRGVAPAAWVAQARERAGWIPGVAAVDTDALHAAEDPKAAQEAELDAIAEALRDLKIDFVRETDAPDAAALEAMTTKAQRALELAQLLGHDVRFSCHGYNDAPGGSELNRSLRERRAQWLCAELARRGVPAERLAQGDTAADAADASTIAVRAASLRLHRDGR